MKIFISIIFCLFGINIGLCQQFTLSNSDSMQIEKLDSNLNVIEIANEFLGRPYVSKTLEIKGEPLVIDFQNVDCNTFVEYVVALESVKADTNKIYSYSHTLTNLRYRKGERNGYGSRLHYFSEWLFQNEQNGYLKDITKDLGGINYKKNINFISTHPQYYPLLDSIELEKIRLSEQDISQYSRCYIPQEKVSTIEKQLKTGDIVAFTTDIKGLDVVHVGFVVWKNSKPYLLHASSDHKKVIVSAKTISEYILGNKKQTGIIVARLK